MCSSLFINYWPQMDTLASAVSETLSVFDLQQDVALLGQIATKFEQLDSHASQQTAGFNAKLADLKHQLDQIRSSCRSLKQSSSFKSTKASMVQLENEIFETAKALTTLNMEINTVKLTYNQDLKRLDELENELNALRLSFSSSLQNIPNSALDKLNPNAISDRTRIIKMKLYDSLGLKIDVDQNELVILNKSQNKLVNLKIDDNYSDYFISNYIWDNM